jgi:hypothetical protein
MKRRVVAIFADAPIVFFAIVIGVAMTFRVAVGWARQASTPLVVAPTFVTGPEPGLAEANANANANVQPLGAPPPARVAPRPRGHGHRPIRGDR